jgi:mannosyltransferase OCH1-like enzyme
MNHRRALFSFLAVLALFLVGTLVVLSSISYFLSINPAAYILERDVPENYTTNSTQERIPRIIHQTWKTDSLPPRWRNISQACRAMMSD